LKYAEIFASKLIEHCKRFGALESSLFHFDGWCDQKREGSCSMPSPLGDSRSWLLHRLWSKTTSCVAHGTAEVDFYTRLRAVREKNMK